MPHLKYCSSRLHGRERGAVSDVSDKFHLWCLFYFFRTSYLPPALSVLWNKYQVQPAPCLSTAESLFLRFEERAALWALVLARAHLSHNSKFHRPKDHLTHSLPYNTLQRSDPSKHSVQRKTIDHGMRSSMLPSVVLSFCWHPALCNVNCLQLAELALCLSCLVLSCLATLHLWLTELVCCICIYLCFYVTFWDTLK